MGFLGGLPFRTGHLSAVWASPHILLPGDCTGATALCPGQRVATLQPPKKVGEGMKGKSKEEPDESVKWADFDYDSNSSDDLGGNFAGFF